MPPFLWIGSGAIALLTATVGLVWYLASQPDTSRQDPKPDTPPVHSPNGEKQPPITVAKNDELAEQQRQLEDETKRVEEKKRLADEQLAKEEAVRREEERRRQIAGQRAAKEQELAAQRARQAQRAKEEAERLEQQRQRDLEAKKLREQEQRLKAGDEDKAAFVAQQSKDAAERREQERQRELALQRAREEEQKRKAAAEEEKARQNTRQQEHERVARAFPDTQLTSLLNKFQRAYERCDFGTLQSLSQMSDRRKDNVEFMFSNYTGFTASIQNVTETQDGASATLLLHTGTRVTGETIPIRELSGTFKIKVTRRGQEWDKIVW